MPITPDLPPDVRKKTEDLARCLQQGLKRGAIGYEMDSTAEIPAVKGSKYEALLNSKEESDREAAKEIRKFLDRTLQKTPLDTAIPALADQYNQVAERERKAKTKAEKDDAANTREMIEQTLEQLITSGRQNMENFVNQQREISSTPKMIESIGEYNKPIDKALYDKAPIGGGIKNANEVDPFKDREFIKLSKDDQKLIDRQVTVQMKLRYPGDKEAIEIMSLKEAEEAISLKINEKREKLSAPLSLEDLKKQDMDKRETDALETLEVPRAVSTTPTLPHPVKTSPAR